MKGAPGAAIGGGGTRVIFNGATAAAVKSASRSLVTISHPFTSGRAAVVPSTPYVRECSTCCSSCPMSRDSFLLSSVLRERRVPLLSRHARWISRGSRGEPVTVATRVPFHYSLSDGPLGGPQAAIKLQMKYCFSSLWEESKFF